jgi:hypothetical protein
MNHKRIKMMSIVLASLMLVSLFAVVSSAASVSGQTSGKPAAHATNLVGGVMAGTGPAVTGSNAAGGDNLYAVDTSGTLWYTPMGGSSSGTWTSLGGVSTASPAAISWYSSYLRLDVFVRGTDGALWHKYYQNGWSGWESLGGQLASGTGPAVCSWNAGRLDVFAQGTDGALWHKWWNGASWSGWESLGGKLTASPAAVAPYTSPAFGSAINVFARGTDGACWEKAWNGASWSSWHSLGGQLAPNTGPASSQDGWLFVQGKDGQLWHWNGGTAWSPLSGEPPEPLSASSPASFLPHQDSVVAVSTTYGNVWWSGDSLDTFSSWSSVGSP